MIQEIKKQIYDTLSNTLGYNVSDNASEKKKYPYVRIILSNTTRDKFKNVFQYKVKYQIDIFSDYDGEAEILQMENEIFEALIPALYENENVTYVRENSFRIIDDKSTGVVRKHGIIQYTILSTGGVIEEDESENNGIETQ